MIVVVDANILFSALINPSGKTGELLFSNELELFTPEFVLAELHDHKDLILEKTGFKDEELDLLVTLISTRITILSHVFFDHAMPLAEKITPDVDDTEYFALALHLTCPLWSSDKALKKQKDVAVLNTQELLTHLKSHSLVTNKPKNM